MRTQTMAIVVLASFAQILNTSFAQDTLKAKNDSLPIFYATAKVALYTGNLHDLEGMGTAKLKIASDVNSKVTDAFHTAFKGAENDKWFYHDKRGKEYLVKFDYDKKDYKVLLDKKGKVFYTLYDGVERDLSTGIRKTIKVWYPDYTIVGLVKIDTYNKDASIVNMRNGNELLIISVEDGAISELGPYKVDEYNRAGQKRERKPALAVAKPTKG